MPEKNSNLIDELKQIKDRELDILNRIDQIKQNSDDEFLPEIEEIERNSWSTVVKIDEMSKNVDAREAELIGRNTVLFITASKSSEGSRRQKIGNVWI